MRLSSFVLALPLLIATARAPTPIASTTTPPAPTSTTVTSATSSSVGAVQTPSELVVARAREEVTRGVSYDPAWYPMRYPGGDVDSSLGVCTDVVVRGYRAAGVDLQKLVHEDVLRAGAAYVPWVKTPDASIDHRRVGPLLTYLRRHARALPVDGDYAAGDIVVISFNACPSCSPQHVGVVSDKLGPRKLPLLIHNMGPTPREDDTLDAWTHLGHFRVLS
jgi:uncharacterized protein YijF (DUF1287 family)